jgi:hypothetical protein
MTFADRRDLMCARTVRVLQKTLKYLAPELVNDFETNSY